MSKETPSADPVVTRRGLLFPVTAGFGLATRGLGLCGLAQGMGATGVPRIAASVDLSTIPEGEYLSVRISRYPVFIRHRTPDEIASAEADDRARLIDQLARNPNFDAEAIATDANRLATPDGRFIAVDGRCTRLLACVVLGPAGDFGGWFCPCCGAQYDTSGRIRKGPGPRNLGIPFLQLRDGMILDIYPAVSPPLHYLHRLLYGAKG